MVLFVFWLQLQSKHVPRNLAAFFEARAKQKHEFYILAERKKKGTLPSKVATRTKRKNKKDGNQKSSGGAPAQPSDEEAVINLNEAYLLQREPLLGAALQLLRKLAMSFAQYGTLAISLQLVASGQVCVEFCAASHGVLSCFVSFLFVGPPRAFLCRSNLIVLFNARLSLERPGWCASWSRTSTLLYRLP